MTDKKTIKIDDEQIRIDVGIVFGTEAGRRVLFYLIARYNVFGIHTITDRDVMAYQEGQRAVVLDVIEKAVGDTLYVDRQAQTAGAMYPATRTQEGK